MATVIWVWCLIIDLQTLDQAKNAAELIKTNSRILPLETQLWLFNLHSKVPRKERQLIFLVVYLVLYRGWLIAPPQVVRVP